MTEEEPKQKGKKYLLSEILGTNDTWNSTRERRARAAINLQEQKLKEELEPAKSAAGHSNTHKGLSCNKVFLETNPDLLVLSPPIDKRLKDEAKEITRVEWKTNVKIKYRSATH